MKLSENVHMLQVVSNRVYYPVILHDDNNLVLVDTGFPLDFDALKNAINASGFEIKDINKIIITHQDIDHIGCVKELLNISPDIEVMSHIDEAPYINGKAIPIKLAKMDATNPFYEQFKASFDNRRITINKELISNEILPFCGGVEVIHTPGHTPGHICLYVKQDKIMICGDALNIVDGNLVGSNPIHTDNVSSAEQSARMLMDYDVKIFVTYHCGIYARA